MHRICLVEDEQSLREMIALNLELEGYAVDTYADGAQAQKEQPQTALRASN